MELKIKVLPDDFPTPTEPRLRLVYLIARATGLRESEIMHLRIEDVLDENGNVRPVVRVLGKRKKWAGVRWGPDLRRQTADYLAKHRPGVKQGWLFTSTNYGKDREQRWTEKGMTASWRKWQRDNNIIPPFNFHCTRHTAITRFLKATGNIKLTQMFARHSSLAMTGLYLHPTENELWEAVDKIEKEGIQ